MKKHRSDIALIKRYLKGELSAKEMYRLERRAQNDPLLMDLLQGMEEGDTRMHLENLSDIKDRMRRRLQGEITENKSSLMWWMAASVMGALVFVGYWFLRKEPMLTPTLVQEQKTITDSQPAIKADSTPLVAMKPAKERKTNPQSPSSVRSRATLKGAPEVSPNKRGEQQLSATKENESDSSLHVNAKTAIAAVVPKEKPTARPMQGAIGEENSKESRVDAVVEKAEMPEVAYQAYARRNRTLDSNLMVAQATNNELEEVLISSRATPKARRTVSSKLASRKQGIYVMNDSLMIPSARLVAEPLIGWEAYEKYLQESVTTMKGKAGKVILVFQLNKDGKPEKIQLVKGIDSALDKRAIEILQNGPAWKKMAVDQTISIDIHFQ
ncbi:energy transducer TonB [Olivibacter sp. CPCC 100613]|uniref:energy transducer TonB family protein n=1 Tax=Olivibacter sp. CPCC 100613 TaxID=3079931 RepID=UPI002FFC9398